MDKVSHLRLEVVTREVLHMENQCYIGASDERKALHLSYGYSKWKRYRGGSRRDIVEDPFP